MRVNQHELKASAAITRIDIRLFRTSETRYFPNTSTLRGTWHGQNARIVANAPNPDMIG